MFLPKNPPQPTRKRKKFLPLKKKFTDPKKKKNNNNNNNKIEVLANKLLKLPRLKEFPEELLNLKINLL